LAKDIDWIEACGDYVTFYVGNRTHLLRQAMNKTESQLDPERFLRIHRSTIVSDFKNPRARRAGQSGVSAPSSRWQRVERRAGVIAIESRSGYRTKKSSAAFLSASCLACRRERSWSFVES
jgi:hypothetical protein